ncbi:hypothetical protein SDC9_91428 [bioreactor metagenome]|uniref:Uncharacterized protein n=1 Tax=bioreactor metagenome TaxID=1076179 RepID=A0A644ZVF2_9ZZZZ
MQTCNEGNHTRYRLQAVFIHQAIADDVRPFHQFSYRDIQIEFIFHCFPHVFVRGPLVAEMILQLGVHSEFLQ